MLSKETPIRPDASRLLLLDSHKFRKAKIKLIIFPPRLVSAPN